MPQYLQLRAFAVHIFTASGAGLALAALLAAAERRWVLMFVFLGIQLLVDGVDGALARRFQVAEVLPRWSGDALDLVIDFTAYVFVPAYAIVTSGLLPPPLAVPAGVLIVMTSAIYFADREMKTADSYFRGFPALWNAVAFYLFILQPAPWFNVGLIVVLAILTFVPIKFVHPIRVIRLRAVNIAALLLWAGLATIALMRDLAPGPLVAGGLTVIALYFVAVGLTAGASSDD
jgi:phosphatidylcholine synthase